MSHKKGKLADNIMDLTPIISEGVCRQRRTARLDLIRSDGMVITLNITATDMVENFDGKKTIKAVWRMLTDTYDEPESALKSDLISLTRQLIELEFVEFKDMPSKGIN